MCSRQEKISTSDARRAAEPTQYRTGPVVHTAGAPTMAESSWRVGQVVDVETEDGWERARILGPSKTGKWDEMYIRFEDGVTDDW